MKRMKKKVVAMVTLAMFVMSMLPMAAFAADKFDPQASKFSTVEPGVEVNVTDEVETVFQIVDKTGAVAQDATNVLVWAEEAGNISSAATFTGGTTVASGNNNKIFKINNLGAVANDTELKVEFSRPGTYTLKAATYDGTSAIQAGDTTKEAFENVKGLSYLGSLAGYETVKVTEEVAELKSVKFEQKWNSNTGKALEDEATFALNDVIMNTIDKGEFTLTAFDQVAAAGKVLAGKEIDVASNSDNLVLTCDEKTDAAGKLNVKYQAKHAGKYTITVSADSYKAYLTLNIKADEAVPEYIATTKDGGVVNRNADMSKTATFANAVQFEITDKNGNAIENTNTNLNKEEIFKNPNGKIYKYAEVVDQPKNSLKAENIRVAYDADKDVYTLNLANFTGRLEKGEYTVKVALLSNDTAEATFTVAEPGDATELIIDGPDVVKAGDEYKATLKYVDANGIETPAYGTQLIAGYYKTASVDAEKSKDFNVSSDNAISFTAKSGEAYYGTKVTVYVMDNKYNNYVTKDITVVDPSVADEFTVQFDNLEGAINKDNTVKVSVLNADGKVVKEVDAASAQAYVAKVSDEDANVTVDKEFTVNDGKGEIKVYADKACTADIVVAISDGDKIYAGNFTYTFGKQDIPADTSVVMTLGSTEMLVNNNIVDMKDAAPFAQNNRTYVPFRALGEALGAEVEYDQTAKTVTYELGSTKIVMTLDSKTYTVNGAEKTMDVAPFAKDNRTYVPVRFVGEGLGFEVTGLTNANGQYVAVAFTK